MRPTTALLLLLPFLAAGCGAVDRHAISAHGVQVRAPKGWRRIPPASNPPAVRDPRTLLVVGTAGVRPGSSRCQIDAYRIPDRGAAVVVVGWRSVTAAGGGPAAPGRASLRRLVTVARPFTPCFPGRGGVAGVLLGGRPYQVNVLVGDRASEEHVAQAVVIARSFDLAR